LRQRAIWLAEHRSDLGTCLPERLADLARDHAGDRLLLGLHQLREAPQRLGAALGGEIAPGRPGTAGGVDAGIHVLQRVREGALKRVEIRGRLQLDLAAGRCGNDERTVQVVAARLEGIRLRHCRASGSAPAWA
jgi:hypothetical protein